MKIKIDFVTNSSSNCYILCVESMDLYEEIHKYVMELGAHEFACESCYTQYFGMSVIELNTFTQGHPWDWASEPRGLQYHYLGPYDYKTILNYILKKDRNIAIAKVDRNVSHFFTEKYKKYIIKEIAW